MCECFGFCAGVDLLKALCQKRVHLGTSDPAHMVSSSRAHDVLFLLGSRNPNVCSSVCPVVKVQLHLQVSASGTRGDEPAQTQVSTEHLVHDPYADEQNNISNRAGEKP